MKHKRSSLTQIFSKLTTLYKASKTKTMKNKADQIKQQFLEDTQSRMEKIKELSEENFVLLSPIGDKCEGYYLNYVRIYDYMELFSTLKSILNVSILALEEQQDLTLHIKNKESDVKAVLEFAKNLIPLEEAIYLDKMRELMLFDKKGK
tara:strand:+ start:1999 stop:2445 length:447 start_codon:yes stop_codon:yes gene_type:complete